MNRLPTLLAVLVTCALVLTGCGDASTGERQAVSCRIEQPLVSGCGVWWGAFVSPDTGADDTSATALLRLEQQVGRRLAIAHRYHDMSTGKRGVFPDAAERALGTDRLLYIGWASRVYGGTDYTWRQIADGTIDATVIDPAARRVASYGRQFFIDFDHEPEAHPRNGSEADFVAAYRHIQNRFKALGAHNAVWVWTVTGFKDHWNQYDAWYPGDDVVDWVAWDPYDFGECHQSDRKTFDETIDPFYDWLVDHHPRKPFMLAEYGTVVGPNDAARAVRWYGELVPALKDHPRIRAVVQFDHRPGTDDPSAAGCDTRIRPASVLRAWSDAGLDPYVNPPLPP